jgi:hypothetical protein
LIVKRERMSSEDSVESREYPSKGNKRDDPLRTQSRISFFQNEKLAEKISRDHSMKKIKQERNHVGLLSEMNEKKKLIPKTGGKSQSRSKDKSE